jgi:phosphopantothenoylcysteine synthetase/decarboxylase
MNLLVTAGNTLALIDKVRCLTNVFTGRTGASIALEALERRHTVRLLTSHPEAVEGLSAGRPLDPARWSVVRYRTFEDLHARMGEAIAPGGWDAIVHCAAVSDYLSGGVYSPAEGTAFDPASLTWSSPGAVAMTDRAAGKVKSDEPELWVRLVRAPKLVDRIRPDWGFRGVLVKFKLEVGLTDEQLLDVAERSRRHSDADLMVANTLEGAKNYAFVGPLAGGYVRVSRVSLAAKLIDVVEGHVAGR